MGKSEMDLNNTILLNAVKAFKPSKIRLSGTLQDKVIYETGKPQQPCPQFVNNSEMFGFSEGCLPMSRWDELSTFFKKAGAVVIFGLNALSGRTLTSDGSAVGPWNSTNAELNPLYAIPSTRIIQYMVGSLEMN
ncbi:heparanase-like protein 3 [Telopea speciosissima]|uniref:heparanase-like protein 3 n=1 Tax=Telopea speciosissima TaxID=54955 RepID=UPI001CC76AB2|nr:heparanase-like protein 3 [Telopea speciosissima]